MQSARETPFDLIQSLTKCLPANSKGRAAWASEPERMREKGTRTRSLAGRVL
jgi:hypothetical protein